MPKAYLVDSISKKCIKTTQNGNFKEIISINEIENALKKLNLEYKSLSAIEIYNLISYILNKKES